MSEITQPQKVQSSRGGVRLPVELFYRIGFNLDPQLAEDRQALRSLTLVCYRFREIYQPSLFERVCIRPMNSRDEGDDNHAANTGLAALLSRPQVKYSVKELFCSFSPSRNAEFKDCGIFLDLPKLEKLEICPVGRMVELPFVNYVAHADTYFGFGSILDRYLAPKPKSFLTKLVLRDTITSIFDILLACPQLIDLELSGVTSTKLTSESSPVPQHIVERGFQLKRFCGAPDSNMMFFPSILLSYFRQVEDLSIVSYIRWQQDPKDMTPFAALDTVFRNVRRLEIGSADDFNFRRLYGGPEHLFGVLEELSIVVNLCALGSLERTLGMIRGIERLCIHVESDYNSLVQCKSFLEDKIAESFPDICIKGYLREICFDFIGPWPKNTHCKWHIIDIMCDTFHKIDTFDNNRIEIIKIRITLDKPDHLSMLDPGSGNRLIQQWESAINLFRTDINIAEQLPFLKAIRLEVRLSRGAHHSQNIEMAMQSLTTAIRHLSENGVLGAGIPKKYEWNDWEHEMIGVTYVVQ